MASFMKTTLITAVLILTFALPGRANADFIATLSVDIADQPQGMFLYTYTLSVSPFSSLSSDGFDVSVDVSANLTSIINNVPGWDTFYETGDPSIGFGAEEFSPFLMPGNSAVFSFSSPLAPVLQDFTMFGSDVTGQSSDSISGQILSPSISVPEPTSMIPLGIGMATLAGYSVYRGKREQ
jgi:hypothetical protein